MNQKQEKVVLRPIALEDTENIVKWRNQEAVCRNLYTTVPLTPQQHTDWLKNVVFTGKCTQYIISVERGNSWVDIGTTFIKNIDRKSMKGEFGIFIGEDWARGKGYARLATYQMLNIAFDSLLLNRVYLSVMADNLPGIYSYKKAGFLEEGLLKEEYLRSDGYVDVIIMGITKQKWYSNKEVYLEQHGSSVDKNRIEKSKIVIIGASKSQNPLIEKAKEMGYETHVFAWKTGDIGERTADVFYPISIMNVDEIYEKCLQINPVSVVTIASDHAAQVVQQLSERLGFVTNTAKTLRSMTNKLIMHKLLEGKIQMADYQEVNDRLGDEYYDHLRYPCIVKPTDRTGGRGIQKVYNRRELIDAIAYARDMSFERKAIIEEYLEGEEYSCETFSSGGKHSIVAYTKVRRCLTKGSLLHGEYSQPAFLPSELRTQIDNMIVRVLDIFGFEHGPSHIEFVVTKENAVKIIEVSPTIGGDGVGALLTPAATGCDYLKLVIQESCGTLQLDRSGNFLPPFHLVEDIFSIKIVNAQNDYTRFEELSNLEKSPVMDTSGMGNLCAQDIGNVQQKYGYYLVRYPSIEMGSYLPLELTRRETPFDQYSEGSVIGVNSIKTALRLALQCLGEKEVYVPYLYSTTLVTFLEKIGYRVVKYHIGEDMLPEEILKGRPIVLMNYFGIMEAALADYASKCTCPVIVDNSFAYFAPHISGTYSIYECTKFLGVTNGAYLVGDICCDTNFPVDVANGRSAHLLKALELGTSAAYKDYYTNEQRVGNEAELMSTLTKQLLAGVNYDHIIQKRRENYLFLQQRLSAEEYALPEGAVPQTFPLVATPRVREALVKRKIYVPSYWRKCAEGNQLNTTELKMMESICCLPIDQRYDQEQMEYMVQVLESLM